MMDRAITTTFLTETHGRTAGHWLNVFLAGARRTLTADCVTSLVDLLCASMAATPTEQPYVMPAIFARPPDRRGTKREVGGLIGYVIDLDATSPERRSRRRYFANVEAAETALEALPLGLTPSIVVQSGGGLHLWYVFAEPLYFDAPDSAIRAEERWRRLHRTIARLLAVEIDAPNLVQPYRIPGTWNGKYTPPRAISIVRWTGTRVHPAALDDLLDASPDRGASRTPPGWPIVTLPTDLPTVDVLTLGISRRIRRLIVVGDVQSGRYASRSEAVFAVATAMVAAGYDDATIAAVLLDPRHAVSAKPRAQGALWVAGEIERARCKHGLGARHAVPPDAATFGDGFAAMRCRPTDPFVSATTMRTVEASTRWRR